MTSDGWKLVPVEPTPEMLYAARDWSIQKNGIAVGNDQASGCYRAMLAAAPVPPQREPHCRCRACLALLAEPVVEFTVCPKCGNKRCPKADNHRNACTGSNEPGQVAQADAIRALGEQHD